jgi:hypothetical protein
MTRETQSAPVPARDKQAEEDLWQRYGAERGVWTESMLIALDRGKEGNKWFSLIDKVRSERTLGMAWEPSGARQPAGRLPRRGEGRGAARSKK